LHVWNDQRKNELTGRVSREQLENEAARTALAKQAASAVSKPKLKLTKVFY